MKVKLVSITKPIIEGLASTEDIVAYCARVSNPSNQMNTETAPKLIRYLIKNKHWSPFEMVSLCFEIETSRAIAAQILRHRSFSFQEFSQRYAQVTTLEPIEFRSQGKTNRQVGEDRVELDPETALQVNIAQQYCSDLYNRLVDKGIAKECARMILPLNTQTRIYMNGTLRSWIHYLELRTHQHTQKEHRQIALAIQEIVFKEFPNIKQALEDIKAEVAV
jgi:thymidylate synthase (FAD)